MFIESAIIAIDHKSKQDQKQSILSKQKWQNLLYNTLQKPMLMSIYVLCIGLYCLPLAHMMLNRGFSVFLSISTPHYVNEYIINQLGWEVYGVAVNDMFYRKSGVVFC